MTMLATDNSAPFLGASLLTTADAETRDTLFQALTESRITAGTPLLSQGKPNPRLWFVKDGSVAIERKQPDGRVDVLGILSGPAMYGTTTFFRSTVPSATIRSTTDLVVWTLDHPSYERLRREKPRVAEALALEVVRVLSERFDQLDDRLAQMMAEHDEDHPRATEWARFRDRLFEEPAA